MSLNDKLLNGKQIVWKSFGEVGELVRGNGLPKSDFTETGIPAIHYGEIYKYYNTCITETISFVSIETANRLKKVNTGDVIITNTSENLEDVGKSVVYLGENFAVTGGHATIFKPSESIKGKYLVYFTQTSMFHKMKRKYAKGAKVIDISANDLKKIIIPIPPLDIQIEIIKKLDAFSKLTTELITGLTTELTSRKKQYSFYREQLLTFNESEVKHLPMDDKSLGEFIRGKRFVKTDMISEGIPCIHYGEMYTHYDTWADKTKSFVNKELVEKKNLRLAEKGDVVVVAAGETIEDIGKGTAWFGEEGVVIHDACFYYKSDLNPKYVAYFTRTRQFHDQIKKHIRTGKISAINAKGLGKAIIPVPSTQEQERIVDILDKFDILTTSLSEALPKEIELRKKQYEYYRNKLLTFPKDTLKEK